MTLIVAGSALLTIVNVGLWTDYLVFAIAVHRRERRTARSHSTLRVLAIAWMMVVSTALMGIGYALELLAGHTTQHPGLILAAGWRAAALIIGLWLAVDRRRHPYPER